MMRPAMEVLDENSVNSDADLTFHQTPLTAILPFPRIYTTWHESYQTTTGSYPVSFWPAILNHQRTFTTFSASNELNILRSHPFSLQLHEESFYPKAPKMPDTSSPVLKKKPRISLSTLRASFSAPNGQILVTGHGKDRKFTAFPAHFNLSTLLNILLSIDQSLLRSHNFLSQKTKNGNTDKDLSSLANGSDLSVGQKRMMTDLTLDEATPQSPIANIASHFSSLADPRIERTKDHKLFDIIVIAICAVVCGANHWTDVAKFGRAKERWFQSFLELPKGMDSLYISSCFYAVRARRI